MTLFWLCCAWLIGVMLAPALPISASEWALLTTVAAAAAIWLRTTTALRMLFLLLAMGCLAGARAALLPAPPPGLSQYNDSGLTFIIRGKIASFPDRRDQHTQFALELTDSRVGESEWMAASGQVLIQSDPMQALHFGDEIELAGQAETPPTFEGFDYQAYLLRQGIRTIFQASRVQILNGPNEFSLLNPIYRYRELAHQRLRRLLPEPAESLIAGITLGIESGIPDDVRDAFDTTGTTHIIAISGFNISIIAAMSTQSLGRWLGVRRGSLAAAFSVTVYTLLVGADAAVVRAALMAGVTMIGRRLGRASDGYAALALAAMLMTALQPQVIWDVGFQLSFAATLGLVAYGERLTRAASRLMTGQLRMRPEQVGRWLPPISEYFLLTLAAQITTLPLVAYHFQRIAWVSPLANLLILPAQPPLMVLGGIAAIAGTIWLPLGQVLAWAAWPFAGYTIRVVELLSELPFASTTMASLSVLWLVLAYVVILGLTVALGQQEVRRWFVSIERVGSVGLVAATGLASIFAWQIARARPNGMLVLNFFDVSPGPGVLIESPTGRRVLIDGGGSGLALGNALDRRLAPLSRDLDWVILTQPSGEAIAGTLMIPDRYLLGGLLLADAGESRQVAELTTALRRADRPVLHASDGVSMALGNGARLIFRQAGESGLAILIDYGDFRALLMPAPVPGWLSGLPPAVRSRGADFVLVPAAGDVTLSDPSQLVRLEPMVVVLAPGEDQAAQPPPASLRQAMTGRMMIPPGEYGWIQIATDGSSLWLFAERVPASPEG